MADILTMTNITCETYLDDISLTQAHIISMGVWSDIKSQAYIDDVSITQHHNLSLSSIAGNTYINAPTLLPARYLDKQSPRFFRALTDTEKAAYGATATIYFRVKSVDVFGNESAYSSINEDASALAVETADVEDYQLTPQLFDVPIPLVDGLSITDDSPGAGSVAWGTFDLYLNGVKYSINAGNSSDEFIVFKDLSTTLDTSTTHPSENWSNWDPEEDFLIIWNNSGTGKAAWSTFMNLVATSAFIGAAAIQTANIDDLAVSDAKINDLDADKIQAGTITVGKFSQNTIDSYGPIVTDPTFALTQSDADTNFWGQVVPANVTWGASTGENGPGFALVGDAGSNVGIYVNDGAGNDRLYPAGNGDKFVCRIRLKKSVGFSGDVRFYLATYDEGKTVISYPYDSVLPSADDTWETITAQITITNTDCHFVRIILLVPAGSSGTITIDSVNVTKDQNANFRHASDITKIDGGEIYANSITLSDHGAGALALGDDLDDVSDGSTYGRVAVTSITGGKIILTSGTGVSGSLPVANTDADVTSSNPQAASWLTDGGALATGDDLDDVPDGTSYERVLATEITAGKITIAGVTNEVVLDGSAGKVYIKSSTFGNDGVQLDYNSGNPRFHVGNGSTKKFEYDGTDFSFVGGDIELLTGNDILLKASDSNPSKIIFEDSDGSNDIEINRDATLDRLAIMPTNDTTCKLYLGVGGSNEFSEIHQYAEDKIEIRARYTTNRFSQIDVLSGSNTTDNYMTFQVSGVSNGTLKFDGVTLWPSLGDGAIDLGKSSGRYRSIMLERQDSAPSSPAAGMLVYAGTSWTGDSKSKIAYYAAGTWYKCDAVPV